MSCGISSVHWERAELGSYHDLCGGYHQCSGVCAVGGILILVCIGIYHDLCGEISFVHWGISSVHLGCSVH